MDEIKKVCFLLSSFWSCTLRKNFFFFSFQRVHLILIGQDQLWVACSVLTLRNAYSPKSPDLTPPSLPLSTKKAGRHKSLISKPFNWPLLRVLLPVPCNWSLRRLSNIRAQSKEPFPGSGTVWSVGDRWVICLGEMYEATHSYTITWVWAEPVDDCGMYFLYSSLRSVSVRPSQPQALFCYSLYVSLYAKRQPPPFPVYDMSRNCVVIY